MVKRTIERINPDEIQNEVDGQDTFLLHMERYQFALEYIKPGNILDMACGNGYGSDFLSMKLKDCTITGVDISESAIEFAKKRYQRSNLNYICSEAANFTSNLLFDTIISLETLEHLENPVEFVHNIKQFLNPGGRFVVSVPITYSTDVNPYHFHDFTQKQLIAIFENEGFNLIQLTRQFQKFSLFNIFSKKRKQTFEFRKNLIAFYLKNPICIARRIMTIIRYGFTNIYLECVFEKKSL